MKYKKEDIKTIDSSFVDYVSSNLDMFLPSGTKSKSPASLAGILADVAISITLSKVTVMKYGNWWSVSCGADWLKPDSNNSVSSYFSKFHSCEPHGPNACHYEPVLFVCASCIFTIGREREELIKGKAPDFALLEDIKKSSPNWKRIVIYQI